jgi:8-oxo-dGTP pyrophosphatase MutT (NUDIX family)
MVTPVNNSSTILAQGSPNAHQVADKVRSCIKLDAYHNCYINLSDIAGFGKTEFKAVKQLLPQIIEEQIQQKKGIGEKLHVIGLKLSPQQSRIVKYAAECGFVFHNANSEGMLMTKCLEGHQVTHCTYPRFMTVSVGVTGVVFDHQLEKVLVVQERLGANKKLKPPTGTVDYLKGTDDPLSAVVRELKEETHLDVNPADAVLVGNTWSANFRGTSPDINYVFAFRVSSNVLLKAQEEEISKIEWKPVQEYLAESLEEASKPWVIKRIVFAALEALNNKKEWRTHTLFWSSGKPVTLFSFNAGPKL